MITKEQAEKLNIGDYIYEIATDPSGSFGGGLSYVDSLEVFSKNHFSKYVDNVSYFLTADEAFDYLGK